jgi:hypothetical protein
MQQLKSKSERILSGFTICTLFIFSSFLEFLFFRIMAYTTNSPTHRRIGSGGSKDGSQQQHIYEEQPYYANERPASRHSVGRDSRRSAGVCDIFIFFFLRREILRDYKTNTFSHLLVTLSCFFFISRIISPLKIVFFSMK